MHLVSAANQLSLPRRRNTIATRCPFVSVIIVNYNGKHFLDDCLEALAAQDYPWDRFEVLVVDNGSTDGSVAHLREHYSWVRVIPLDRNRGFARGNNEGFQHAQGDLIALLNNDTMVTPDWLSALVDAIGTDPRTGAATSKILFKSQPDQINNAGLVLYRDGSGADRGFRQLDEGQFDEPVEVFGACGASLLVRREMLEDVGGFDERLFMYYEDLDLAWRARMRGWSFRYTPSSVVYHVHCGSSGEWSPFFLYYVERNRVLVNWKNAPVPQACRVLASFGWRVLRKWGRLLTRLDRSERDLGHGLAYAKAALSLMLVLPEMIAKRFLIRFWRRTVADRSFAHLIDSVPCSE
jgi:GT2 family glycosyltransferase